MNTDTRQEESPASERNAAPGRWVTPEVNYVDPVRHFCAFCGRPIARKFWQTGEDEGATYCDPTHAARHATYPGSIGSR